MTNPVPPASEQAASKKPRLRWVHAVVAAVLGTGLILLLRTEGKVIHLEWMADLVWLLPLVLLLWSLHFRSGPDPRRE